MDSAASKEPIFTRQAVFEAYLYQNPQDIASTSEVAACLGLPFSRHKYLEEVSVIVLDGDEGADGNSDPKKVEAHSQLVQQIIATQANLKDENILTVRLNLADDREQSVLSLLTAITEARGGHPPTVVVTFGYSFGINLSAHSVDPLIDQPTATLHGLSRSLSLSELQANPTTFSEGLKELRDVRPELTNEVNEALSQIDLFGKLAAFLSHHSNDAKIFQGLPNLPRLQYAVHIPGSAAENHVLVGATDPSGNRSSYTYPHSPYVEATGRGTVLYVPHDFKPANTSFNHSVLLVSSKLMSMPAGGLAGEYLDEKRLSVAEEQKARDLARSIHSSKTSLVKRQAQVEELERLVKDKALSPAVAYDILGDSKAYEVFEGVPWSKRWIQLTSISLDKIAPTSSNSPVSPLSYTGFLFVSVTNSSGRSVLAPVATGHSWATPDHVATQLQLRNSQSNSWTAVAWREVSTWLPALGIGTLLGYLLNARRRPTLVVTEEPDATDS